ncbi:MAG: phage portal protein [Oscillospiraceae bacterium]|nr:phage portal protein [Oscillospiraceae bacterium]
MVIYMDRAEVPDVEQIRPEVLRYLLDKAQRQVGRFRMLEDYYLGNHPALRGKKGEGEVRVAVNYAKYVVDMALGYYLGEAVKYDSNEIARAGAQRGGKIDLSWLLYWYDFQNIAEVDLELGRGMGIFGECIELCYASSEQRPRPRSTWLFPGNAVLVCDDSVEHRKLFGMVWERRESLTGQQYYTMTVYTDRTIRHYRSADVKNIAFYPEGEVQEHWFGEVPMILYENNGPRQGDFEQIISLIDAYNQLLSSRLTDKKKFVDALLVFFGMTLREGDEGRLARERFLDGAPLDARVEYIQKTFDESGVQVLADALVREMHKMTQTVDMSDEKFSGNSSGQALKLKLLSMELLVKSKMRRMEKGLKERLRLYNRWLYAMGEMDLVDPAEVDVVFTVNRPIDEEGILDLVTRLQGIVDDQTLLSQLWFVKDPAEALENVRKQKEEGEKDE